MSAQAGNDAGEASKFHRVDPHSPSNGSKNPDAITPADNPELDASMEDIPSSGTEGQVARMEIQELFDELAEPIKNFLQGNRERAIANIYASFQTIVQEIEHFLNLQSEERQKLYENYSHQLRTLNVKLNMDAEQVKKQGDKLASMFQDQQKLIEESQTLEREKMEQLKLLCEQYLKCVPLYSLVKGKEEVNIAHVTLLVCSADGREQSIPLRAISSYWSLGDLGGSQGNVVATELKKLMGILEIKLRMAACPEERSAVQQSLLDMLFS